MVHLEIKSIMHIGIPAQMLNRDPGDTVQYHSWPAACPLSSGRGRQVQPERNTGATRGRYLSALTVHFKVLTRSGRETKGIRHSAQPAALQGPVSDGQVRRTRAMSTRKA